MNLLDLTETCNGDSIEDRQLSLMVQTGLSDRNLSTLTAGYLPPTNANVIDKLITDLNRKADNRNAILIKLINTVINSFNPVTRADYLWYLQFTVTVLLLKDTPTSIYALQGNLLTLCFNASTTTWDSNPIKLDYFASQLYDLIEGDKNLIFVANQIENRSTFGLHLSLCMLWKSIYRCVGEEKTMFRLYPPSNLIGLTKRINQKKLDKDFEIVLTFILLHSKIASLIFHRKLRSPHNKCNEEFFAFDLGLIKTLKEFLENLTAKAEAMWRNENENLDYLTMYEYLQIDVSEFDALIRNLQK
ncbi:hypothetical protein HA402_007854 [Bradysia odoriphaga]|nr:hypothetical protein HA402_007854 [Bradysia odoriphaga]